MLSLPKMVLGQVRFAVAVVDAVDATVFVCLFCLLVLLLYLYLG